MSKSLGVLVLDLVARTGSFVEGMSKAERSSEKWRKKVTKDAQEVGRKLGIASAASVAALTAITASSVKAAAEITKLSQVAGTSTLDFQRYSAGASLLGIQQEKLADIFKDTSDKVGDFLQTGGGPLADFFENIAPKIGVTAEQFRNLSGPQALGLYVSSLEKANVSQNEMTFFMEAIASDATLLLPLLRDGAKGFNLLGDAAQRAGAIMDDDALRAANELNAQMFLLKLTSQGVKNQIADQLIPAVVSLVTELDHLTKKGDAATGTAEALGNLFRWTAATGLGFAASVELLGSRLSGLVEIASAVPKGLDAVRAAAVGVGVEFDAIAQKYATAIKNVLSVEARPKTTDLLKEIVDLMDQAREAGSPSVTGFDKEADAAAKAAQRLAESIAEQVGQLQFQSMYVHKSADELTLLKLAAQGATESQLALAESALANIAAFEAQTEAEKAMLEEMKRINTDALGIAESLKGEEQLIRESYERRKQIILDNTAITGEARQKLLLQNEQRTNEELEKITRGYWGDYLASMEENFANMDTLTADMLNNLTTRFGSTFEAMVFDAESVEDAVYKLADGMLRSIVNALGQMAGQWIAYQAVQLATGQSTQAAVAASSVASGTAIAAAYAPAAAMASLASFGANSAPAMAGITATSSLAKGLALVGMAHDGIDSVPQTGTWLLQKGERVTTADTSAKLDKTLSGLQSGMGGKPEINLRVVNAYDKTVMKDFLGSSEGEQVVMNHVTRNARTIRAITI